MNKNIHEPFPNSEQRQAKAFAELVWNKPVETLLFWLTKTQNPEHRDTIQSELQRQQLADLVTSSRNLESSSTRVEALTRWLIVLTIVLGFLTLLLVLDVANKFRQEYFSGPPPLSAPQAPAPPAHLSGQ